MVNLDKYLGEAGKKKGTTSAANIVKKITGK